MPTFAVICWESSLHSNLKFKVVNPFIKQILTINFIWQHKVILIEKPIPKQTAQHQRDNDVCLIVQAAYKENPCLSSNALPDNLKRWPCLPMSKAAFAELEEALIKVFLLPWVFKQIRCMNCTRFIDFWEPSQTFKNHLLENSLLYLHL